MTRSVFNSIALRGVAASVPAARVDNRVDHPYTSREDCEKVVTLTGVNEYRKADADTCASDLCVQAARDLLEATGVSAVDINAIVFVSMTPDYRIPSTACLIQDRIGCSNAAVAFDINMGCSGYVVGLYNACSLINGGQLDNVLLLTGDTQSKLCYEHDKNVSFLLADAGTASLLQRDEDAAPITIELHTDGSRYRSLYVPAGGFRNMSSDETREVHTGDDGGARSDDHLFMNGMDIFKFSSTDVVESIEDFMRELGTGPDDYKNLFLHQANKFMTDKIASRLKFARDKVPYSLQQYGNTGSASIPLTIAHHFSSTECEPSGRQLLSGFGVGLSWGAVDVQFDGVVVPPVADYGTVANTTRPVQRRDAILLFPGQGAQFVGMGRDLFESRQETRSLFEKASEILGMDMGALCFDGPDAELVKTNNVQPAVTLVNIATYNALRDAGVEPVAVGGHSLGEYAALYAAGVLSLEDVLGLVRRRGELMQAAADANPGGMLAILGIRLGEVESVLDRLALDGVEIANINSPSETILTGAIESLERVAEAATEAGALGAVALRVSGPWHSKYMASAADGMRDAIAAVDFREPAMPVACNVTGKEYSDAEEMRARLVEQVVSPVRWADCLRTLLGRAPDVEVIESGPGRTLTKLSGFIESSCKARSFEEFIDNANKSAA